MSPSTRGTTRPLRVALQRGSVSTTPPFVESAMPSTTRSERIPSSLIAAFHVSVRRSRSVSSRPSPARRTPEYVVSPAASTLKDAGSNASASSNTEPKSKSTAVLFARARRVASSHTQNSRNSTRERSSPVGERVCVSERQRGPGWEGRTQLSRPRSGEPGRLLARPSTVSALSVSHSTGSADCPWPATRIVGSICWGRNCIGTS